MKHNAEEVSEIALKFHFGSGDVMQKILLHKYGLIIIFRISSSQALHGLAPKCKLINMHELINKSTNDYVTLLPCENGANVNNKR